MIWVRCPDGDTRGGARRRVRRARTGHPGRAGLPRGRRGHADRPGRAASCSASRSWTSCSAASSRPRPGIRYADLAQPGVRFVPGDRHARSTRRPRGRHRRRLVRRRTSWWSRSGPTCTPRRPPGWSRAGTSSTPSPAPFALRDVLRGFTGGRVVVGVTSTPFKCPPAPSETALLMHEFLTDRGLRDRSKISLVMPLGVPIPPSPQASAAVLAAFAEHGIHWYPERLVRALDPDRRVARLSDDTELPYDLFLGVPVHRVPGGRRGIRAGGRRLDSGRPAHPARPRFPRSSRSATSPASAPPRPGSSPRGRRPSRRPASSRPSTAARRRPTTTGAASATSNSAGGAVAKVDVTFQAGLRPVGDLEGPSTTLVAEKTAFGATRVQRWFNHP